MNTAYLKQNVVVRVAPNGWVPPPELDYDATANGAGASIGATWNGVSYVAPPVPIEQQNYISIRSNAETAMVQLRQYRNLASPTAAQRLVFERITARVLLGLIRLELNQMEDTE